MFRNTSATNINQVLQVVTWWFGPIFCVPLKRLNRSDLHLGKQSRSLWRSFQSVDHLHPIHLIHPLGSSNVIKRHLLKEFLDLEPATPLKPPHKIRGIMSNDPQVACTIIQTRCLANLGYSRSLVAFPFPQVCQVFSNMETLRTPFKAPTFRNLSLLSQSSHEFLYENKRTILGFEVDIPTSSLRHGSCIFIPIFAIVMLTGAHPHPCSWFTHHLGKKNMVILISSTAQNTVDILSTSPTR